MLAGVAKAADAVQLVEAINQRYEQVNNLTATVDFAASVGGAHKGQETDYTSIRGYIIFQKPQMLRVLGLVPVLHTHAFDLASNGETFTLLIPPRSRAIVGSNSVTNPSASTLENMRPQFFLDAILIQSISPDRIVSLTNSSTTTMDTRTKQLIETPQYELTVLNPGPAGGPPGMAKVYQAQRVIKFSRVDLLPTEQDIYDKNGDPETQVLYGKYQTYSGIQFPSTITIIRTLEEYRIALTVEKVIFNQPLPPDQFVPPKIPEGYKVQRLP
jgi:hypothetical protein